MPILGIIASSYAQVTGSFESIATVSVGSGGTSTVSFTSIPSTYAHLQIRALARTSNGSTGDNIKLKVNSDTGTNYAWHGLGGDGSSTFINVDYARSPAVPFQASGANATASIFSGAVIDILDYASTNKNKTIRSLWGCDQNGSGTVALVSNLWVNTSAITRIDLYGDAAFVQYTHFALYGIRSA